jgi:hypothetical protein
MKGNFRLLFIWASIFLFLGLIERYLVPIQKQIAPNYSDNEHLQVEYESYYPSSLPYYASPREDLPLILPNASFELAEYEPLTASGFHNSYIDPSGRLYMVQIKSGYILPDYVNSSAIRKFEKNLYIIQSTVKDLKQIQNDPAVNFMDNYHPHFKLDPRIHKAWADDQIKTSTKLAITFSPLLSEAEIKNYLNEPAESSLQPIITNENGLTYLITGITNRNELFTYALNPNISEIRIIE